MDLFAFGDLDGKGTEARLKHPLGVAFADSESCLYVADSYNHKIKRVTQLDSKTPLCQSVALTEGSFREPGGLVMANNGVSQLFIADTNTSQVKVIGGLNSALLTTDELSVKTLEIKHENSGASLSNDFVDSSNKKEEIHNATNIQDQEVEIFLQAGDMHRRVNLEFKLSSNNNSASINEQAPNTCKFQKLPSGCSANCEVWNRALLTFDGQLVPGPVGNAHAEIKLFLCHAKDGTCFMRNIHIKFKILVLPEPVEFNTNITVCLQV